MVRAPVMRLPAAMPFFANTFCDNHRTHASWLTLQ